MSALDGLNIKVVFYDTSHLLMSESGYNNHLKDDKLVNDDYCIELRLGDSVYAMLLDGVHKFTVCENKHGLYLDCIDGLLGYVEQHQKTKRWYLVRYHNKEVV